jgi:hypothetical protein
MDSAQRMGRLRALLSGALDGTAEGNVEQKTSYARAKEH